MLLLLDLGRNVDDVLVLWLCCDDRFSNNAGLTYCNSLASSWYLAPSTLFLLFFLDALLLQETENVVENIVSAGLLRKEERLHELAPRLTAVAHLPDYLDDDSSRSARLRVHAMDENLAVLIA